MNIHILKKSWTCYTRYQQKSQLSGFLQARHCCCSCPVYLNETAQHDQADQAVVDQAVVGHIKGRRHVHPVVASLAVLEVWIEENPVESFSIMILVTSPESL